MDATADQIETEDCFQNKKINQSIRRKSLSNSFQENQTVQTNGDKFILSMCCVDYQSLTGTKMQFKCQMEDCNEFASFICNCPHRSFLGCGGISSYKGCNLKVCADHIIIKHSMRGKIISYRCNDTFYSICNIKYFFMTGQWFLYLLFLSILGAIMYFVYIFYIQLPYFPSSIQS